MRNRQRSLHARLFWAFTLVTVIAIALPAVFSRNALYQDRIEQAGKEALAHATFAKTFFDSNPTEEQIRQLLASAVTLSLRMTVTDRRGSVLLDSHIGESELPSLDNHADRPEIEAAHATGTGISLRHSNTLGVDAVYAAVALRNGGTLRIAVPLADIRHSLERRLPSILGVLFAVAMLCLLLSVIITGKVRKRMDDMAEVVASISRDTGSGGERRRLRDVHWREMQPLAIAVNHMADNIEAYVATTSDQQSQLETILDSIHEGVLVLGPTGAVRRWNMSLALLFPNITGAEGRQLIEAIPFPALQSRVDLLLSQDAEAYPDESIHFEMPSGRFLVAHISPPAARNSSLGAVIVIYDATDIMRLERVRRDFVSNVSHELRTPLTAISLYAETLMMSDELSEEQKGFAEIIHNHSVSLAKTVTDLLDLARIENTREPVTLSATDVEPIVADAVFSIQKQVEANGIALRINLEPAPVRANAALLTQVFRNLLENACRYSKENDTVCITSRREGEMVLFIVTDNGPGIPEEAQPRIFERFYQVKKERNSGTAGIGLAICKHIIERHGGRIWVESPHGKAATAMLFTLPAASSGA